MQSLKSWGGITSIASGLLLGVSVITRFSGYSLAAQAASFTAVLILVFALTALYTVQAVQGGRLAFSGYVLAVIGSILTEVVSFLWIATYSGLTEAHAIVMFSWGTFPILHVAVIGSFLGLLLFGIATARASVYPKWSGLIMAAGAVIYTLAEYFPMLYNLALPGVLAIGLSLIWMGWTLVSNTSRQVVQTAAATTP
jgi:hypothetical protein